MRITIDEAVCNTPEAHDWLDRILDKIEDRWHVWDVSESEGHLETTWITAAGRKARKMREMYEAAQRLTAWSLAPHGRRVHVCAAPARARAVPRGRSPLGRDAARGSRREPTV